MTRIAGRGAAGAAVPALTIGGMQLRQILVVVVAFIAIVGAALIIVSWDGDSDDSDELADDATTTVPTNSTTSSITTTTAIPADCTTPIVPTSTTPSAESTTTGAGPDADEPDLPVVPTLGANSSVSTVGLDTVSFGLTVAQAEAAAGTIMIPCTPVGDCYRIVPLDAPAGISFVVTDGTIERVDIVDGPIETLSGIGVGTDESRIFELFGLSIVVEDNGDTADLVFVPTSESDAEFRVVFTIRDGVVERFRAGRLPIVLDDSPCA